MIVAPGRDWHGAAEASQDNSSGGANTAVGHGRLPSDATRVYFVSVGGKTTRNLDASQTFWAFVSQFALAS